MSLFSLKQLLLRKTEDESLRTLIKMVAEDVLADQVIESLEKMANRKGKGKLVNEAVNHFGLQMDPEVDPAMIREALGHHASRYKAALAADDKKMANDHAAKFFKIIEMAHLAQPNSRGKLNIEAVDIKPWERTHPSRSETYAEKMARDPQYAEKVKTWHLGRGKGKLHDGLTNPNGYVIDTVGFKFQPAGSDWSFLQNDPHESYSNETSKHGHVGAYPMEHVKVNGKHIHIEPVENIHDGNKNHPFDFHPILSHYSESNDSRTPERDAQYKKEHKEFYDSPHVESHLMHQHSLIESGAYDTRGKGLGEQIHPTSRRVEVGKPVQAQPTSAKPISKPAPQSQTAAPQDKPKVITRKAPISDKEKAKAILPSYLHDLLKD